MEQNGQEVASGAESQPDQGPALSQDRGLFQCQSPRKELDSALSVRILLFLL